MWQLDSIEATLRVAMREIDFLSQIVAFQRERTLDDLADRPTEADILVAEAVQRRIGDAIQMIQEIRNADPR